MKCEAEIRKYAAEGNQSGLRIMAKQLVGLQQQRERLLKSSATIGAISSQVTVMASTAKVASAMGTATKVIAAQNKAMKDSGVVETMRRCGIEWGTSVSLSVSVSVSLSLSLSLSCFV